MTLGAQTTVVDGQRFAVPGSAAYNPYGFGQIVQPQPIQNVNFPPMLPGGGSTGGGGALGEAIGGYGTAGQNAAAAGLANQSPWGLRESPLVWWLIVLAIGGGLMAWVFFRKVNFSGESAHIGPAKEEATV